MIEEKSNVFYVYVIVNNINRKIYVGKSNNPSKRWMRHKRIANNKEKYKKFFSYLHSALLKYKTENFSFFIIGKYIEENDAFIGEKFWISYLKEIECNLYNLTDGGEGVSGAKINFGINNSNYGKKITEERRKFLSELAKNRKISKETRNKMSLSSMGDKNPFYGKNHTQESKDKISKSKVKTDNDTLKCIIEDLKKENYTQAEIVDKYHISKSNVSRIKIKHLGK